MKSFPFEIVEENLVKEYTLSRSTSAVSQICNDTKTILQEIFLIKPNKTFKYDEFYNTQTGSPTGLNESPQISNKDDNILSNIKQTTPKPNTIGSNDKTKIWTFFFIVMVLIVIYNLINHHSITYNYNDKPQYTSADMQEKAYLFSQEFVKDKIKSPSSAIFPENGFRCFVNDFDSTYTIKSFVDAQNGFGAMIRTNYRVQMKYTGGNVNDGHNWRLIGINIYDQY